MVDANANIEFAEIIKNSLKSFDADPKFVDDGFVLSLNDGIVKAFGISDVFLDEIVLISNEIRAIVIGIEENYVLLTIIERESEVKQGDLISRTREEFKIKIGKSCLGRVFNGIGDVIDGLGEIEDFSLSGIHGEAPSIMDRQSVHEGLKTGIISIDSLIPIGRGQRELIIGDRQTGKTTVALDTIINQAKINEKIDEKDRVYSIYVAIGQKASSVAKLVEDLKAMDAMKYTIVIAATAADSALSQYYAPYVGCTMGEFFRDNKMHALVVYDDLSKHAVTYRQISLLLKRPPGREAYPGDCFYIHSKLLERAAKLSERKGAGSLTALPVIETQANDLSGYIPTNVISITDGQIFLETELFLKKTLPAINVGLSVSRVGSMAQSKIVKKIAGTLKLDLSQFREMEAFSQFASDLDEENKLIINRGQKITQILNQNAHKPLSETEEVYLLYTIYSKLIDKIDIQDIEKFKEITVEKARISDDKIDNEEKFFAKIHEEIETIIDNLGKKV